jgi:hypothetical protein
LIRGDQPMEPYEPMCIMCRLKVPPFTDMKDALTECPRCDRVGGKRLRP